MARRIEAHFIAGPAGRLEALLETPEGGAPTEAALVCHPHPLYGGAMHNKVVHRLSRGLRAGGTVVARINFRGVGLSEGNYGHGAGEVEDARAALGWLRRRYPHLPCCLAGFSFGARVIMKLGCQLKSVSRLIAAGFPPSYAQRADFRACPAPRHFFHSTHDEICPPEDFSDFYAGLQEPKSLVWIEAADHFFTGSLDRLELEVSQLPRP